MSDFRDLTGEEQGKLRKILWSKFFDKYCRDDFSEDEPDEESDDYQQWYSEKVFIEDARSLSEFCECFGPISLDYLRELDVDSILDEAILERVGKETDAGRTALARFSAHYGIDLEPY